MGRLSQVEKCYVCYGRPAISRACKELPSASPGAYKLEKVLLIVLDTVVKELVSNYGELRESIGKYYNEFLKSLIDGSQLERIGIVVAPGAGVFRMDGGNYAEFQGSLTDFTSYVAFEITRHLLEATGNELNVHLDLTHGVNFMPSLTYAALREILTGLAISKKTRLPVYNAEPYVRK
jgi:CRISPR-associated protein Csx1